MGISDSFFSLPFGKIRVYGLISPRFCGMGSEHWVATIFPLPDFNLPFARFPKNMEIFGPPTWYKLYGI
jgi:hypothetical protein